MALVGNISGSGGTSNTVGITGSLIIANPGLGTFPGLGGNDVALFVSGNIAGSTATSPNYNVRGTTVFGGDIVTSGTLFSSSPVFAGGGLTGSLQQTAGGLSYLVAGANVTIASASNGQITISSTGGGGGGAGVFTEASGIAAFTTSSIAIGIAAAASTIGSDVFFFVSGSINGTADALFGGDVVTSGSVTVLNNVISGSAGGNIVLGSAGSIAVVGGLTAGGGYGDTGVTLSGAGNVRANGFLQVDGEAYLTGSVTLAGNSQSVTHTGTGNLSISSTTGNVLVEGTVFVGNNVTIPGDLTVNGTVVAIDTTNLRIKDPIVLIGSGSVAADSKSVIAFASGSSGGINSLVFGAAGVVGGNFLAAAQADVQDGSLPIGSLSLTNYVPIRASSFQLGGTSAAPAVFVSSSVGTDLILSGTTANLGSTIFNFQRADSTFATFGGNGPGTGATLAGASGRFLTVGAINGTLNLSGSTVAANFSSAFQFQEDGVSVIEVTAPTTTTPRVAAAVSNATLTVGTSGASSSIVVSGSTAVLQTTAANGVYFRADAADMLRIVSPSANTVNIDPQSGFTTANVVNTIATTVSFAGAATSLTIGDATTATTAIRGGTLVGNTTTQNLFNTTATTLNIGGAATTLELGAATGTTSVNNDLAVDGNTTLGNAATDTTTVAGSLAVNGTSASSTNKITSTQTSFDLLNTTVTTLNIGGAATTLELGAATGTTSVNNDLAVDGNTTLGSATTDTITFTARAASDFLPTADSTHDLGSPTLRWKNMYTGDLHLRNDRGSWTIIEEADYLSITNNLDGRRYKFVLKEI